MHGRDRGKFAMALVKFEQLGDVQIRDAVAVGHAKSLAAQMLRNASNASPRHAIQPRIKQRDAKIVVRRRVVRDPRCRHPMLIVTSPVIAR